MLDNMFDLGNNIGERVGHVIRNEQKHYMPGANAAENAYTQKIQKASELSKKQILDTYGIDLNEEDLKQALDTLIGQNDNKQQILDVLINDIEQNGGKNVGHILNIGKNELISRVKLAQYRRMVKEKMEGSNIQRMIDKMRAENEAQAQRETMRPMNIPTPDAPMNIPTPDAQDDPIHTYPDINEMLGNYEDNTMQDQLNIGEDGDTIDKLMQAPDAKLENIAKILNARRLTKEQQRGEHFAMRRLQQQAQAEMQAKADNEKKQREYSEQARQSKADKDIIKAVTTEHQKALDITNISDVDEAMRALNMNEVKPHHAKTLMQYQKFQPSTILETITRYDIQQLIRQEGIVVPPNIDERQVLTDVEKSADKSLRDRVSAGLKKIHQKFTESLLRELRSITEIQLQETDNKIRQLNHNIVELESARNYASNDPATTNKCNRLITEYNKEIVALLEQKTPLEANLSELNLLTNQDLDLEIQAANKEQKKKQAIADASKITHHANEGLMELVHSTIASSAAKTRATKAEHESKIQAHKAEEQRNRVTLLQETQIRETAEKIAAQKTKQIQSHADTIEYIEKSSKQLSDIIKNCSDEVGKFVENSTVACRKIYDNVTKAQNNVSDGNSQLNEELAKENTELLMSVIRNIVYSNVVSAIVDGVVQNHKSWIRMIGVDKGLPTIHKRLTNITNSGLAHQAIITMALGLKNNIHEAFMIKPKIRGVFQPNDNGQVPAELSHNRRSDIDHIFQNAVCNNDFISDITNTLNLIIGRTQGSGAMILPPLQGLHKILYNTAIEGMQQAIEEALQECKIESDKSYLENTCHVEIKYDIPDALDQLGNTPVKGVRNIVAKELTAGLNQRCAHCNEEIKHISRASLNDHIPIVPIIREEVPDENVFIQTSDLLTFIHKTKDTIQKNLDDSHTEMRSLLEQTRNELESCYNTDGTVVLGVNQISTPYNEANPAVEYDMSQVPDTFIKIKKEICTPTEAASLILQASNKTMQKMNEVISQCTDKRIKTIIKPNDKAKTLKISDHTEVTIGAKGYFQSFLDSISSRLATAKQMIKDAAKHTSHFMRVTKNYFRDKYEDVNYYISANRIKVVKWITITCLSTLFTYAIGYYIANIQVIRIIGL